MARSAWRQGPETSGHSILNQLHEAGLITEREAVNQRQALLEGVLIPDRTAKPIKPAVVDVGVMPTLEKIYGALADQYGKETLVKGDVTIVSTLDLDLQRRVARIANTTVSTSEIQQLVIVVLDDRNQLRAAYGTGDLSPEETGLGPLQRIAWSSKLTDLEIFNTPDDFSLLQLAELHSLVARNGVKYETGVLLEISDRSGQQVDRFSHRVSEKFDFRTITEIANELDDLLTIDDNIGVSEGQVRVRGKLGGDDERNVMWYGGASARFAVALWMSYPLEDTTSGEVEGSQLGNGREAVRVAGTIFSELHSDG